MVRTCFSKNGITIRLTDERWNHIIENHDELAGMKDVVLSTVSNPDEIRDGDFGELIAISFLGKKNI